MSCILNSFHKAVERMRLWGQKHPCCAFFALFGLFPLTILVLMAFTTAVVWPLSMLFGWL